MVTAEGCTWISGREVWDPNSSWSPAGTVRPAALSKSLSLAGKGTLKLSSDAKRSVRPRVFASIGVRLESSAAFRHSEPGLNSARGSPGGRGADARDPRRCVVSARRVARSLTLWCLYPSPQAICPALGYGDAAGIRQEPSVR